MNPRAVYINWPISSFYGWGVYGLNLALNWANDPDLAAGCAHPLLARNIVVDALQLRGLDGFIRRSAEFHALLEPFKEQDATAEAAVVSYFDHGFVTPRSAHGVQLSGKPTIAATFFESAHITTENIARAAAYPLVVTGSTWNTQVLRAHGLTNVRQVIQGIDPTLFHPGHARGDLPDRFLVFSGGKLERRKGQDLVLAAFRSFAERHPDAMLVTAWNNPWNVFAPTLNTSALVAPLPVDANGRIDIPGWMAANGIAPENYLDLGMPANASMPPILREMDVALFPNRAEGGTNLVAMEAMACGVPTILSRNTGHTDLIEGENCYPLAQQRALSGQEAGFGDVAGWGESDIAEIVETLERIYAHRHEARRRGLRGAATLSRFTWARTAQEMKDLVLETAS